MSRIVMTGSTGNLGGRVARRLAAAGIAQLLLVRDPARAPALPLVTVAKAGFTDVTAVTAAIGPGDTVLMVSASETLDRVDQHTTFVDAVAAAGAGHLVYISFYGAAPDATFTLARDHWVTERHIRASGLAFTFLRDNLYADFLPAMTGADGVLRGPADAGRVSAVAQDDIADVAAAILRAPGEHAGQAYDLTGPQALTLAEIAQVITAETGRNVSYREETIDEAYRSRAVYDAPGWQVDAWVSTYTAIANGELDGVSDAVERIAGHPATSLADLLRR
jgi:Predicted nucleoside-diphosphate-sugar epimerases